MAKAHPKHHVEPSAKFQVCALKSGDIKVSQINCYSILTFSSNFILRKGHFTKNVVKLQTTENRVFYLEVLATPTTLTILRITDTTNKAIVSYRQDTLFL